MTGREVVVNYPPKRIISLVPSQTELLYDLGLDEEVVGITKFCVHPNEWFRNKKRVGGTKTVHMDIIHALQPHLIIANKEENTKEQVEELALRYPVWISNIQTVEEGLQMISEVGAVTGKTTEANLLVQNIRTGFNDLAAETANVKVAYYIWKNPWMSVGGDTFISDMIATMGWQNVLTDKRRYPEVSPAELVGSDVELVLLSSEPYPFKDKHILEIKEVLPAVEVLLVDGEMFSWYGSRMKEAPGYLKHIASQYTSRNL